MRSLLPFRPILLWHQPAWFSVDAEVSHIAILIGDPEAGLMLAYLEYFNIACVATVLPYTGSSLVRATYAVDVLAGKEIPVTIDESVVATLSWSASPELGDQALINDVSSRVHRVIEIAQERSHRVTAGTGTNEAADAPDGQGATGSEESLEQQLARFLRKHPGEPDYAPSEEAANRVPIDGRCRRSLELPLIMLDPTDLAASLDAFSLGGLALAPAEVRRIRRACADGAVAEFEDQAGFGIVASILGPVARIASPGMTADRPPISVFILKTDLCNACAVAPPERDPVVFIHGGLIKAILFHLELAELVYRLHGALGEDLMIGGQATASDGSLSLLAYGAASNLDHYALEGHPLPRLGRALPAEAKNKLLVAFARSLWFVALHEIAHIRLGHTVGRPNFASAPTLAIAEDINISKAQEFEADAYMAGRLEGNERAAAIDYLLTPLDLIATLERRLSLSANTHPMALNRLSAMLGRVQGMVSVEKTAAAQRMVEALVERRQSGHTAHKVMLKSARTAAGHLVQFHDQLPEPPPTNDTKRSSHPWDDVAGHWFGPDS
jgi:hypothetical protein